MDEFLIKITIGDERAKSDDIYNEIHCAKSVLSSDNSDSDKVFSSLSEEFKLYFSGQLREFKQPFKLIKGTSFQRDVWLTLPEIPFGETRTYKWLAAKIEKPLSYRAVGQALKINPLPLILPCHRIIASDGSTGGFSCGIDIKKRLLEHELRHTLKSDAKSS